MIMMRRGRFFLKGIIILIQLWYQFVLVFQFSSCPVARLFLFLWNVSLVAQFMIVLPIFGLSKNPPKLAEHIWELKVPSGLKMIATLAHSLPYCVRFWLQVRAPSPAYACPIG